MSFYKNKKNPSQKNYQSPDDKSTRMYTEKGANTKAGTKTDRNSATSRYNIFSPRVINLSSKLCRFYTNTIYNNNDMQSNDENFEDQGHQSEQAYTDQYELEQQNNQSGLTPKYQYSHQNSSSVTEQHYNPNGLKINTGLTPRYDQPPTNRSLNIPVFGRGMHNRMNTEDGIQEKTSTENGDQHKRLGLGSHGISSVNYSSQSNRDDKPGGISDRYTKHHSISTDVQQPLGHKLLLKKNKSQHQTFNSSVAGNGNQQNYSEPITDAISLPLINKNYQYNKKLSLVGARIQKDLEGIAMAIKTSHVRTEEEDKQMQLERASVALENKSVRHEFRSVNSKVVPLYNLDYLMHNYNAGQQQKVPTYLRVRMKDFNDYYEVVDRIEEEIPDETDISKYTGFMTGFGSQRKAKPLGGDYRGFSLVVKELLDDANKHNQVESMRDLNSTNPHITKSDYKHSETQFYASGGLQGKKISIKEGMTKSMTKFEDISLEKDDKISLGEESKSECHENDASIGTKEEGEDYNEYASDYEDSPRNSNQPDHLFKKKEATGFNPNKRTSILKSPQNRQHLSPKSRKRRRSKRQKKTVSVVDDNGQIIQVEIGETGEIIWEGIEEKIEENIHHINFGHSAYGEVHPDSSVEVKKNKLMHRSKSTVAGKMHTKKGKGKQATLFVIIFFRYKKTGHNLA